MRMECECRMHCEERRREGKITASLLFPGIFLSCPDAELPEDFGTPDYVLQIRCCCRGKVCWKLPDEAPVCLEAGDLVLSTAEAWKHAEAVSQEEYEGFLLHIDLKKLSEQPPEILAGTDITGELLFDRFCAGRRLQFQKGTEQTSHIFSGFYQGSGTCGNCLQKVKALELLLYLLQQKESVPEEGREYPPEQIRVIREIHEQLTTHMDKRITIEELSRQHLMNPTTLKAVFKSVYGTSLAAHMKEHRMGLAAKLLRETDLTIAEVSLRVGYESQSKFTAAFKEYFGMLPKEYRHR